MKKKLNLKRTVTYEIESSGDDPEDINHIKNMSSLDVVEFGCLVHDELLHVERDSGWKEPKFN